MHAKRKNVCKESCRFIKHLHLEGKLRLIIITRMIVETNFFTQSEVFNYIYFTKHSLVDQHAKKSVFKSLGLVDLIFHLPDRLVKHH